MDIHSLKSLGFSDTEIKSVAANEAAHPGINEALYYNIDKILAVATKREIYFALVSTHKDMTGCVRCALSRKFQT